MKAYDSTLYQTGISVINRTGASIYNLRLKVKQQNYVDSGGPRPHTEGFTVPFDAEPIKDDISTVLSGQKISFDVPLPLSQIADGSLELIFRRSPDGNDVHEFPSWRVDTFTGRTY